MNPYSIDTVDDKRSLVEFLDENSNFKNQKASSSKSKRAQVHHFKVLESSSDSEKSNSVETHSFETNSEQSFQECSSYSDDSEQFLADKKRKIQSKNSARRSFYTHKEKRQKTSKSTRDSKVSCDVLKLVQKINSELANLSKSAAILEQDIALYKQAPGVSARTLFTSSSLPTFPMAPNINEFSSDGLVVSVPVKTVGEVNDLNSILKDKIAFENVVSALNLKFCHFPEYRR